MAWRRAAIRVPGAKSPKEAAYTVAISQGVVIGVDLSFCVTTCLLSGDASPMCVET